MKALTQLASMYLLASLVAAIFSTDIISGKESLGADSSDLEKHGTDKAIGVYLAIMMPFFYNLLIYPMA